MYYMPFTCYFWHQMGILTLHKETAVDSFLRQAVTIYHKMSFIESLFSLVYKIVWREILRSKMNGKCIYSIRLTKLCKNLFWSKVERRCDGLSHLLRKGSRATFRLLLWGLIAPRKFSYTSCCPNVEYQEGTEARGVGSFLPAFTLLLWFPLLFIYANTTFLSELHFPWLKETTFCLN